MFRRGPLTVADDGQSGAVNDEVQAGARAGAPKREGEMLTASRERGVIGGREIDAQHPEDRGQAALGLTQRYVEEETERQGGFDGEIGILELPAPPADASRCPRGDRVRREPEGDVASPHEGSVVLGPVPDAIRCLVLRMHSRRLCCNFRAATSGWTTFGKHRTGSPIMPSDNPFKWRQFEPALILQCVRWYLRYALSYRDLEDMMRERGLCVDHTTIYRWVQRYAPEIDKRCRPFLRHTNDSYRIDETYVRVAGAWTYLYRGVDSNGDTLDFLLRATRDRKAAIAFFRKTLGAAHTTPPRVVTVDKNPAYPVAFEAVRHEGLVRPRSNSSAMQVSEQHHRAGTTDSSNAAPGRCWASSDSPRRGGPCAASRSCMRSARDRRDGWRRATWSGRRS